MTDVNFSALFQASPYPYLLIGTDFTLLGANLAYLQVTGRKVEEIVGKHIFDAFPANPADPDATNTKEIRASIERAIKTRRPHTSALLRYAVPKETPEGTVFENRYWSAVHTPVADERGEVLFVVQNAIDVTALYTFDKTSSQYSLKQGLNAVPDVADPGHQQIYQAMKRILATERNHMRILFNQAPGFIAVLMGRNYVFEMVNEAYYQLVGHRDIIGKPLWDALPEVAGQGFEELLDKVSDTGEPLVLRGYKFSVQRDRNGPLSEKYIDMLYHPIFADDGRVSGIFAQGIDVTTTYLATQELADKVKQLEKARERQTFQIRLADALRQSGEESEVFKQGSTLLGRFLKANRVLFGSYDAQRALVTYHSNYVGENTSELTGTYPAAIFGITNFGAVEAGALWVCDDLSTESRTSGPDTWPTFKALDIHAAVVVPLTWEGSVTACLFVNTNLPRQWAEDELEVIKDAAERIWTTVVRVRAEAAIKEANSRKDQFLAMLAHELRNPLAPISAAAEMLKLAHLPPERLRFTSDIITRQVKHMTGLVDDLLDVSRVTQGIVVVQRHEVDIKAVVADAVEQVRPLIDSRGHQLSMQTSLDSTFVLGDYKRLVQIFANLINNAAKYTPPSGVIGVRVAAVDDAVVVDVTDNGVGISTALLPHVFDLFSQGERTSDRSQGGLGLGLALVKSLVELHEGTVKAASQGMDNGSTFTVRLPRLPKVAEQAPYKEEPSGIRSGDSPLRMLVVDDNHDAAQMLGMFLQTRGYHVTVEHESRKALERAMHEPFDAFLLDIGLVDMDGNELARQLRQLPSAKSALMIAITGYGRKFDRETSLAAGFDEYVVKPANPMKLIELLSQVHRAAP